jgi:hypothetical protein
MMEVTRSSESSIFTRAKRRNIPENCTLHMKMLIADISKEVIFEPTSVNEISQGLGNENGIRVVNFTISAKLSLSK